MKTCPETNSVPEKLKENPVWHFADSVHAANSSAESVK